MFLYQIDEVVTGNRVHFGKKYGRLVFPVHNLNRNGLTIEVYHSSYSSLCYSNTLSMYKMPLSTAHWFLDLHLNIQQHNNIISTVINQFLFSANIVAYNNYNSSMFLVHCCYQMIFPMIHITFQSSIRSLVIKKWYSLKSFKNLCLETYHRNISLTKIIYPCIMIFRSLLWDMIKGFESFSSFLCSFF